MSELGQRERVGTLTDEACVAAWMAEGCVVCGGPKAVRVAFCRIDWFALTPWIRRILEAGPQSGETWFTFFRSQAKHLELNHERIHRTALVRRGWEFASEDELLAAGYKQDAWSRCVGCKAAIIWFWTPDKTKIPVDPMTYQPHRTSCTEWQEVLNRAERRRLLQASAPKRRKPRRQGFGGTR